MPALDILQSPVFSERFDTPHYSQPIAPAFRKRKAEGLTLLWLALIVILPLGVLFMAKASFGLGGL